MWRQAVGWVGLSMLLGCGPATPGPGESAGDTSASSGSPSGSSTASTTETTQVADSSTSTGASGPEDVRFDISDSGWNPVACARAEPVLDITEATTPEGELVPLEAFVTDDWCVDDLLIVIVPIDQPWHLAWFVQRDEPDDAVYHGVYDVHAARPSNAFLPGAIEFLEPFDPTIAEDPTASPVIHARLEAHEPGWDFVAEVELPFCAGGYDCYCPCE